MPQSGVHTHASRRPSSTRPIHAARPARRPSPVAHCLLACGLLTLLPACSGSKNYENENDRLRAEVMDLKQQVATLTAQRDEWSAKAREASRSGPIPPDALDAIPRCAGVEIGALTGPGRAPGAGPADAPDRVIAYIGPYDGRQRFVQIAGTLAVEAVWLPGTPVSLAGTPADSLGDTPPDASEPPRRLFARTFTPAEIRDAYRSGLTGTHYTFELTLPPDSRPYLSRSTGSLILRVEFIDALTGQTHKAERVMNAAAPPGPG